MATKKEKLKKTADSKEKKTSLAESKREKYFCAVGRRKTSIAQVRIFNKEKAEEEDLIVNNRPFKKYFPILNFQNSILFPLRTAGLFGKFGMSVLVKGGGINGQAEAVRLGIARALVKFDDSLKKSLKDVGLLTRDSRIVERKKPGLKKARRAPQWQKR